MLSDLYIKEFINQSWEYSGIDTEEHCVDKKHFREYSYPIHYNYNSRGFRDVEWPENLKTSIWCVGDSFTTGVGSPLEHTWPILLRNKISRRTINVSLDGGSNEWIARRSKQIIKEVNPEYMIIMWTFASRREQANNNLTDRERRIHHVPYASELDDLKNWFECYFSVEQSIADTKIIHSVIPNGLPLHYNTMLSGWNNIKDSAWGDMPTSQQQLNLLHKDVVLEIKSKHREWYNYFSEHSESIEFEYQNKQILDKLIYVEQLDFNRDGFHFDVATSKWFIDQLMQKGID